jgi:hypothetical protein
MNELMDRLAAANPVPADEALSGAEQRDVDALLERILDSPPPTEAPAARRVPALRRVAPAAALLALAGLTAIVAVDLLGSEDEGRRGIVERAAAAVSQEDVIYAITERRTVTTRRLGGRGRAASSERTLGRYWLWAGGRRSRFLVYGLRPDAARGPLESEITVDGDRLSWFLAPSNTISVSKVPWRDWPAPPDDRGYPGFSPASDPGAQLRAHVESGRLRVAGRTTVRGRTAYRLVSRPRSVPSEGIKADTVTYLVDARTYLPLEVRNHVIFVHDGAEPDEVGESRTEYLRYEPLPVTEENTALLDMDPHPGARRTRG